MSRRSKPWSSRRDVRLFLVGLGISLVLALAAGVLMWLEDTLSRETVWRAKLSFFIALECLYGFLAFVTMLLTPILGLLIYRARKRRLSRPWHARFLLLCISLLLALVLTEGIAAAWWKRVHRSRVVPVGGSLRALSEPTAKVPRPPERIEMPTEFPDDSDHDMTNIVVVGESSAAGVPYDWFLSLGGVVSWQLEKLMPGRRFRVTNLATAGATLETQHLRLGELTIRPHVLIIYAGHNEFSARFPWSREIQHYSDQKQPRLWDLVVEQAESTSPVCRLIHEQVQACRVALPPSPTGHRLLVDEPAYTPAEYLILLSDFERRLDAMVEFARKVGAIPILIAPPANDSGFEPNRSFLPPQTTRAERTAFEREFLEARRLEETNAEESLRRYRLMLDRQPGFAELHYRVARLLERKGEWDEVYRHDLAARDLDGLPQRCLTRFQEAYRTVAARHACTLIDGQAYFRGIGPHGLLDDQLFHDGMHPSLRGQMALAQAVLQALRDRGFLGWPQSVAVPVLDPLQLGRRFGLTPYAWGKVCSFGIMFYDLTAYARYDPTQRLARRIAFAEALSRIEAGEPAEAVGMPSVGLPAPVPLILDAATIPRATPGIGRSRGAESTRHGP